MKRAQDSLYELEIAFSQIPGPEQGPVPAWLVDRIFRHILVDVTGNTHRAEFCIDKLYSPDSATGRLGLLELRGFEMPPHARMSLTQQLLVRALLAWFWKEPYTCKARFIGARACTINSCCRILSRRISAKCCDDLNRAGYPFEAEWFAPHFEFRYPVFGHAHHAGIEIEIRQATEPWYVLGEEGAPGGTARYVDSSVERVQVQSGGTHGSAVMPSPATGAACRCTPPASRASGWRACAIRAWQPPSCLHPTIPVHTPLIFDVVDTWTGRSRGRMHVSRRASGRTQFRESFR